MIFNGIEISDDETLNVSRFYKSISEPSRLRILLALSNQEMNVSAIVDAIGMEQSAVSHQLKLLKENNLVKSKKEGKMVVYSLDDQHIIDILTQTYLHIKHTKS